MTPFGLMSGPAMGGFGLMQPQDEIDKKEALRMAILQAGLGIMSARTGGNLGAAIGQGGLQGIQAYQQNIQGQKQEKRQAARDAMDEAQFGMRQKQFEAEQESAADQKARQKAFEEAVKGAYQLDAQGNIIGIDKNKYQAALTMLDPSQAAKMFYQGQQEAQPYYQQAVDAQKGLGSFNARTGEFDFPGGLVRPQDNPALQGEIAGAKAGGKVAGETAAQAAIDLPAVESSADSIIAAINQVAEHPGREAATGGSRLFGMHKLPGSRGYNFDAKLANLQGKVFKEAFQAMKGAGAITEQEGKAAESAIANLDAAQSEDQFLAALKDLKTEINRLREIARGKAGQAPSMLTPNTGGWGIRKL